MRRILNLVQVAFSFICKNKLETIWKAKAKTSSAILGSTRVNIKALGEITLPPRLSFRPDPRLYYGACSFKRFSVLKSFYVYVWTGVNDT